MRWAQKKFVYRPAGWQATVSSPSVLGAQIQRTSGHTRFCRNYHCSFFPIYLTQNLHQHFILKILTNKSSMLLFCFCSNAERTISFSHFRYYYRKITKFIIGITYLTVRKNRIKVEVHTCQLLFLVITLKLYLFLSTLIFSYDLISPLSFLYPVC